MNTNHKESLRTVKTAEELNAIQLALETEAFELGAAAVRASFQAAKERGELSKTAGMRGLLAATVEQFHDALEQYVEEATSGRAGRKAALATILANIGDNWLVAYTTVSVTFDSISDNGGVAALAHRIGHALEDAFILRTFKKTNAGLFNHILQAKRKEGRTDGNIAYNLRRTFQQSAEAETTLLNRDYLTIGECLLYLLMESTDVLVEHKVGQDDKKLKSVLGFNDKYLEYVEQVVERIAANSPHHMPMVVEPLAWTNPVIGGYLTKHREAFVRCTNISPSSRNVYLASLAEDPDMADVYAAVNAIQSTPWQINLDVLKVAELVWELGGDMADLPLRDNTDTPNRPAWYYADMCDLMDANEFKAYLEGSAEKQAEFREWRHEMHRFHTGELSNRSKRVATMQTLSIARRFGEYEAFYFPHSLDFRGRIYPIPARLSPQGNDLNKGLLRLTRGKPIGKTGGKWLEIHIANTYGVDKVSFDERRAWVAQNASNISATASNPLENLAFWTKADSPFCFLAACFEYAGYLAQGEDFITHIPIALDGTCNGLQNFSAMLRDPIGGAATNLVPSDRPQDIYARVGSAVEDLLAVDRSEEADVFRGRITRNIVKPNVMTVPYGVTMRGMIDQLIETTTKAGIMGSRDQKDVYALNKYLAAQSYEAIGRVVVAAHGAMDWLKEVAKIVSKSDNPIVWKTPMGFTVRQAYVKQKAITIDTNLGKFRIRRRAVEPTDVLDKAKQAIAISPNFVHAMDATHLMRTVQRCTARGLKDFAFIHDSYGTLACDTDILSAELREAFISIYSENILEDFKQQLMAQIPPEVAAELPPVPPMGSLDLETVRDSLYFFA